MAVDEKLLDQTRVAGARVAELECQAEQAKAEYRRLVRHLHLAGASMREVAGALCISHQRVHQLIDDAGGARRWRRRRTGAGGALVTCSFCGRGAQEVDGQLVAGPSVYICDRCASAAVAVVTTGAPVSRPGAPMRPVEPASAEQCSFCGKQRPMVQALVAGPRSLICAECLDLCQEIMAERLKPQGP